MQLVSEMNSRQSATLLPTFFGRTSSRPLYACHHFAVRQSPENAALMCNSIAHEYERCHRSLRQLAVQLARHDCHAMRFDYFGMGDSAGDYQQASFAQWREDVREALDECKRRAGCQSLSLVGVRIGANLAAQVAAQRNDIDKLVLYAPVLNAHALVTDWQNEQKKFSQKHTHSSRLLDSSEVLGFSLNAAFEAELAEVCSLADVGRSVPQVLLLAEDIDAEGIQSYVASLEDGGATVSLEQVEDAAIWRREPLEAVVPFKTLQRISTWLSEDVK